MKRDISLPRSYRLVNNIGVVMVSSKYRENESIITIAWHLVADYSPVILGVSIGYERYSHGLVTKSREFCINVPLYSQLEQALQCGGCSGRNCEKFELAGFNREKCKRIKAHAIRECPANIECTVIRKVNLDTHTIFLGKVVNARVDTRLFKDYWNTDKAKFIFHMGGNAFTTNGDGV